MNDLNGGLNFTSELDNSKLIADAAKAKATLKGIGDTAVSQGSAVERAFSSAYGLIGAGAVASIGMLGKQILDVTAKFEKFGIVLRNTLGDAKGTDALNMIANFAATTPFQLDEVTAAFIKMANQGFVPTRTEMVKLGDLASSTGKSFDMLAEAILDAQTGEYERLKEFGIKASAAGDKVTFSFKEQKTTVDNSSKSIQAYILSLGELNGIAGANAKISESLTGQMSNLGDKIAAMFNDIGTANKGLLYSAVGVAATLVDNYETIGESIGVLLTMYGAYRLAIWYVAGQQEIMAAANLLVVESNGFLVASEARAIVMAERRVIAQNAVNTSMLANPGVLAAMAVVALGYAVYKLTTLETDLEKSQKALNGTIADTKTTIESERLELDTLFGRLKAAKEGTDDYKAAKDAIFAKYGEQLKALGDEKTALNDIALAYTTITEEALRSARARGMAKATTDAADTASQVTSGAKTDINKLLVDKFGSAKGSEIFYKIIPVIEGKEEITKEIQDVLKQFDTTIYTGGGGMFAQNVAMKSNALDDLLKTAAKANDQYKKTIADAEIAYAGEKAPTEKAFDVTTLSLTELTKELPKAQSALESLKKAEKPDEGAITKQQAKIKSIQAETLAREKQLKVIAETEAQIKLLKDQQNASAGGKDGAEYKALEVRINALSLKLPKASDEAAKDVKKTEKDLADFFEKSQNDILVSQKKTRDKNVAADIQAEDDEIKRTEENQKVLDQIYVDGVEAAHRVDDKATKDKEDKDKKTREDALAKQREISQGFFDIADSASYLSRQIGDSNQGLSDMLVGIANIAGSMGDLVEKGAFSKKGMSKGDAASAIIGGATQMLGIFIGQAAENKRVMEDYYAAVIKQQNDYNLSLNEQLRLNTEIHGSIFFDDFKAKMSDASKALKDATDKKNEAMAKFYGSEAIVGKKNVVSGANVLGGIGAGAAIGAGVGSIVPVIGTALGAAAGALIGGVAALFAKKKKDIVAPLLETYPLLIKANGDFDAGLAKTLIGTENITKETSAILQNVIDWEDAAKAANDQITAVITDMVGSIGSDLKNALVDAFEQGTDSAIKFGEAVNGILEDIISNAVFSAVFGPALKDLQDSLDYNAKNGGDLVTPIRQFLTLVPGLTGLFNSTMATTKDDTGKSTVSTRAMTAAEKSQKEDYEKSRQAEQDNIDEINADLLYTGKAAKAYQTASINASEAEILRLNGLLSVLDSSLIVTTPGLNLFNDPSTVAERTGSSKGITSMSQDSADEMNGRLTAMQGHTFRIADTLDIMRANSGAIMRDVAIIRNNTNRLEAIENNLGAVKAGIDTINRQGITLKN